MVRGQWANLAKMLGFHPYSFFEGHPGIFNSDRPILIFYNRYRYRYLYVYVTDNRYSEPIFIYCYKVNK